MATLVVITQLPAVGSCERLKYQKGIPAQYWQPEKVLHYKSVTMGAAIKGLRHISHQQKAELEDIGEDAEGKGKKRRRSSASCHIKPKREHFFNVLLNVRCAEETGT